MSEVVVVAVMTPNPGAEAEVERLMRELTSPTHAEDGCIAFALHRDLREPGRLVFVERWRDQASLDAHIGAPDLAAFREALGGLLAAPPLLMVLDPVSSGDPAKGTLAGG